MRVERTQESGGDDSLKFSWEKKVTQEMPSNSEECLKKKGGEGVTTRERHRGIRWSEIFKRA